MCAAVKYLVIYITRYLSLSTLLLGIVQAEGWDYRRVCPVDFSFTRQPAKGLSTDYTDFHRLKKQHLFGGRSFGNDAAQKQLRGETVEIGIVIEPPHHSTSKAFKP
jgi:hypothetical protein